MTEAELLKVAARLGEREVAGLDPSQVAEGVLSRLAAAPVAVRPFGKRAAPWLLGLAAAAALLLTLRLTVLDPNPSAPSASSALSELDDLSAIQLEELLVTMPASATDPAPAPGKMPWNDLDTDDLERLLRSLEG